MFFFGHIPILDHDAVKVTGRANKVFFALEDLNPGEPVTMDVYRPDSSVPSSHYGLIGPGSFSRTGGTHGDGLDVPTPGCWRFVVRWSNRSAEFDVEAAGAELAFPISRTSA